MSLKRANERAIAVRSGLYLCRTPDRGGSPPKGWLAREPIMRKSVLALAAAGSVFALTAAAAATLTVTGTPPAQGTTQASCQGTTAIATAYTTVPGETNVEAHVTAVTVSGLEVACSGKKMLVKVLSDDGNTLVAAGFVSIEGVSQTFAFGTDGDLFQTVASSMTDPQTLPVSAPLASAVGKTSVLIAETITSAL